MTNLKNKFVRIYNLHPRTDLNVIDIVYETIRVMQINKQDTTASNIALNCNIDRGKVVRRLALLAESGYVTIKKNKTIPFLSVFNSAGSKKPIYGEIQIGMEIDQNYSLVSGILTSNSLLSRQINPIVQRDFHGFVNQDKKGKHFFDVYNQIVDILIMNGIVCWHMRIRSGANRYKI